MTEIERMLLASLKQISEQYGKALSEQSELHETSLLKLSEQHRLQQLELANSHAQQLVEVRSSFTRLDKLMQGPLATLAKRVDALEQQLRRLVE